THTGNWLPLTWLSHMFDWKLYGAQAGGHHMTNVFFHTASAVLLFVALREMTRATWRSAFVAGFFALHPLRVESVAWVAERKDVLSVFFWMLSMLFYVRYARAKAESKNGSTELSRSVPLNYSIALICFA